MEAPKRKKQDPCEPATEEELEALLLWIRIGDSEHAAQLRSRVSWISEEGIPWDSIRFLNVLGDLDEECNEVLMGAGFLPGVYVNRDGSWMLLIHPRESKFHTYLNRCGKVLNRLCVYQTTFTSLDLTPAAAIRELDLSGNRELSSIHGLGKLSSLTRLSISGCGQIDQLPGVENLEQLTELNIGLCGIKQLPGLENLTHLKSLRLENCQALCEVPAGIRGLGSLRCLYLRRLKLRTLPDWLPEIADRFSWSSFDWEEGKNKAFIDLYRTVVEDIPDMSIFDLPYEMVAEWFASRQRNSMRTLNEIKVVFLGDGEAGKSHTIARLMNGGGEPDHLIFDGQSTPGIVIRNKEYEAKDRKFQVHYWDFGGQEIMHSMHRIFLTGRTMYVILLNARDDTQSDRARYWLHNVKSFAPDAPVLLVLNKIDQNENASVDEPDLRSRYPKLTRVVRLSALKYSQEEFNDRFTKILLEEIQKTGYLDAQWPVSWTQVKKRLEDMRSHYIMGDDYRTICEECGVDRNRETLLHWFNDLGVSFCCCDKDDYKLEDYVILRPDWITNALYILLFNKVEGARNGRIPHKSIYDILKNAHQNPRIRCTLPQARYNNSDIQYVLGVMRKFNLSFAEGGEDEFIPMLCQQNSTVDVGDYRKDADTLEFNMEFDYLPNNLLHRLMVERYRELDLANVWRTGARFHLPELGLSALVVIDGNTLRFFIRHTDPMHRPNTYLTMLKANVDRIVGKMGLKPPVNQLIYKLDGKQDVFDYEMLKAMQETGQTQAFSMSWRRMISIVDIFNQSAPDVPEAEMKLLYEIKRSCQNIQNEPVYRLKKRENGRGYENGTGMEDLRNRRIRDDLCRMGFNIADQTQRGSGELDMLVYNERGEPWTIIEALRIQDTGKTDWNKHLNKLLGRYDCNGLPRLYLLTYVDATLATFSEIWESYEAHIKKYGPAPFACLQDSYTDLNESNGPGYIRTAKCQYLRGDQRTTVYHIFARIPTQGE